MLSLFLLNINNFSFLLSYFQFSQEKIDKYFSKAIEEEYEKRWRSEPPKKMFKSNHHIDADNRNGKTINDLDDNILYYIFCHLGSLDLCILYYTSKRFREIAINVFHRNHKNINVRSSNAIRTRIILLTFGQHIEKMILTYKHIDCTDHQSLITLHEVPELCPNLKQLIITKATINQLTIDLFQNFFNQLEVIGLRNCKINSIIANLFGDNLIKLLIFEEQQEYPMSLFVKQFPKLKEIVTDNGEILQTIMKQNREIENVRILDPPRSNRHFEQIDYTNVKYLTVDHKNPKFLCKNFSNLINLKLSDVQVLFKNLSNLNAIEHLSIQVNHYSAPILNNIVKLENLKTLKLNYPLGNYYIHRYLMYFAKNAPKLESLVCIQTVHVDVIKIIKMMKNLKKIIIDSEQVFDDEFFKKIANIYKERKSSKLQFTVKKKCLNVKKTTCKQYEKYFEIKIL